MYAFRHRETGAYPVTPNVIREAHRAQASFGPTIDPDVADALGYDLVLIDAEPAFDVLTHTLEALPPVLADGAWSQGWAVLARYATQALADAAIAAAADAARRALVPAAVTMRQARLVLLAAGMLGAVNAAIAAMPGAQGEAARIEWEFSSEVKRAQPLVMALGSVLSLTAVQLDNLFIAGAAL